MTISSFSKARNKTVPDSWSFALVGLALASGLILSVLSGLELCVEHCSANQNYRLFGIPFAPVGIAFFFVLLIVHLLSKTNVLLSGILRYFVAMAFGAEIFFISVQKNQIGHWCPVCLSIAASVGIAAIFLSKNFFSELFTDIKQSNRSNIMLKFRQALTTLSFVLSGFLMSFIGVSQADGTQAALADIKERIAFGNKSSDVEIYFFSDWYCPSCKKVEPVIEKMYPDIKSQAAIFFVDYPIHKKSLNFTPYNLAFQVNNKSQYLKARAALAELAEQTESPNDESVNKIAAKHGIRLQELPYLDIENGREFFNGLVTRFNLNSTPIVIVTNKKGSPVIKLDGRDEITEKKVLAAIKKIKENKS